MNIPSASSSSVSPTSAARPGHRLVSALLLTASLSLSSTVLFAQNTGDASGDRRRRGDGASGDRGNASPQDMQARMLSSLRERFEVTDDEEWKLISARIAKVSELRRSAGGGPGGFPGRGGGPDAGRGQRPGSGNPEMTALSSAVRDKLPDAEIKMRLERLRESRKDNEAKLSKAQEDLRAVLSVRQEALAVVFGLLP